MNFKAHGSLLESGGLPSSGCVPVAVKEVKELKCLAE